MPFTLSHPAAVLLLGRWPFVPSALVAGAVAPDVPYYVSPAYTGEPTHETWAVIVLDVPLGLGLLVLFHSLAKWTCLALASDRLRARLVGPALRFEVRTAGRAGLAVLSVALGALTHVLWDAFTHVDGQVAGRVSVLREPWLGDVAGYRVLQHLSTAAGAAVLAVWAWRWARRAEPTPVPPELTPSARRRARLWGGVLSGMAVAAVARAVTAEAGVRATDAVEGAVLGAGLALVLLGLVSPRPARRRGGPARWPAAPRGSRTPGSGRRSRGGGQPPTSG